MILFTKIEDAMNRKNGTKNKTSWTGCFLLGIIGSNHNEERKVIPLGSLAVSHICYNKDLYVDGKLRPGPVTDS